MNRSADTMASPPRDNDGHLLFRYESSRDFQDYIVAGPNEGKITMRTHFHHCLEFHYVEHGLLHDCVSGVEFDVHPGQLAIIPSFSLHSCSCDESTRRMLIMLPRRYLGTLATLLDEQTFAKILIDDDENRTLFNMIRLIVDVRQRSNFFSYLEFGTPNQLNVLTSLITAFVYIVISKTGLRKEERSAILMIEALKYIHIHFREPIRIPDMARELLCTQATLSAQFGETMGMSITEYINHLRAIDAHHSLSLNPAMTLEEAAERSGFGSVRSMLRAYRREYDCTPRERGKKQ